MDKPVSPPSFDAMMASQPEKASSVDESAKAEVLSDGKNSSKSKPKTKGKLEKKPHELSGSALKHAGKIYHSPFIINVDPPFDTFCWLLCKW